MTLHGPDEDDNVFAKILRGEMPCAKVYEDRNIFSFMDVFPQSKGHTLVIPKAPSRNLLETNAKDIGRLFGTAQRIAKAVEAALKPDGIRIMQFNGAPAGQTVFHTHIHILPCFEGTEPGMHGGGGIASMDELNSLAARIKEKLEV